jgi:hypothetical protein
VRFFSSLLEAAHISNLEQPQAYAETMLGFLLGTS